MKLKTACFTYLVLYAVLAGVIGFAVYRRAGDSTPALFAGFIGGFFVFLGISYIFGIGMKIAEARIVGRSLNGVAPVDGKKYAAIGRIHAIGGRSLTSPLTKTQCVCYGYEITKWSKSTRNSSSSKYRIFGGFALVPCTIQSGTTTTRLLAYPDLQTPKSNPAGLQILENAKQYIATTEFFEPKITGVREAFKRWMEQFKDDDGSIRVDERLAPLDEPLDDAFYEEQIVRSGDEVVVIGKYSAEKGALVPDPDAQLHPAILRSGDPRRIRAAGYRSAIGYLVGGVFILTLATIGLAALHIYLPPNIELEPLQAEERFEDIIETKARMPLRKAGFLSQQQELPHVRGWYLDRNGVRNYSSSASATRANGETTVTLNNGVKMLFGPGMELRKLELNERDSAGLVVTATEHDDWIQGKVLGPGCRIYFQTNVEPAP